MADIRKEAIDKVMVAVGGDMIAKAEEADMPGFADELRQSIETMFEADTEIGRLADEMTKIGAAQVDILSRTMEMEQAQLATTLDKAEEGFLKAAQMFQDAVKEFAIFRGGVTDQEVSTLAQESAEAQETRDKARARVVAAGGAFDLGPGGDRRRKSKIERTTSTGNRKVERQTKGGRGCGG